jgi:hypothetical protein
LTDVAAVDIWWCDFNMKKSIQTRFAAALAVVLGLAIFFHANPFAEQHLEAAPNQAIITEYYAPSLTPSIYLINFLFLYVANPDVAANLPAYKAPIPQPVADCLEQNPAGCPYAVFRQFFETPAIGGSENRECSWTDVCQEEAKWEHLAPRKYRQPEQINEPLGKKRADQLAHLLGITPDMILTDVQYHCLVGTPGLRTTNQETFFRCIANMTNSKGNALIPLSSYGLNVNEQGDIRSVCGTNAPCININSLLTGYLEKTAADCGFLKKLICMETKTPFFQFLDDANQCQQSAGSACLIQINCAGK